MHVCESHCGPSAEVLIAIYCWKSFQENLVFSSEREDSVFLKIFYTKLFRLSWPLTLECAKCVHIRFISGRCDPAAWSSAHSLVF